MPICSRFLERGKFLVDIEPEGSVYIWKRVGSDEIVHAGEYCASLPYTTHRHTQSVAN